VALGLASLVCLDFGSRAEAARPAMVGERAPSFTPARADGMSHRLSPGHLTQPVVLIFYRGGWCPYCNLQLADLYVVEPQLRAAGFEVLFVSSDRREFYSSRKNPDIDYTLLSDPQLKAAQPFRIAYQVGSVFLIDQTGTIRFAYSNPDFKVRLGAEDLWKAAQPWKPHVANSKPRPEPQANSCFASRPATSALNGQARSACPAGRPLDDRACNSHDFFAIADGARKLLMGSLGGIPDRTPCETG
jgi:peroxiredoxin